MAKIIDDSNMQNIQFVDHTPMLACVQNYMPIVTRLSCEVIVFSIENTNFISK